MKRKLSEDTNSDRVAKRAKTIQEPQHGVYSRELPSDMWFIILEELTKDCYYENLTDTNRAAVQLAYLSCASKRLQSECQKFKQTKSLATQEKPNAQSFICHYALLGSLSFLKYAHERGVKMIPYYTVLVVQDGHLDCLKYLQSIGTPLDERTEQIACFGTLECVKYIHESQGGKWHSPMCVSAADGGHLDILKYVHETGGTWDAEVCSVAAKHGHLDMLKYAHEHGCEWDSKVYEEASLEGHIDIVKYAHENGCPWNDRSFLRAVETGQLKLLKYLHEIHDAWPPSTCESAAQAGQLECLIYAHEHGAEWHSSRIAIGAVDCRQKNVIEYLRTLGCHIPDEEHY